MKKKNIIPLQPKQAKGITGPKAPEAKAPEAQQPQTVVVYSNEQIQALKNWCYENLKAKEFDGVMQFVNLGQTGSFNAPPPETKKN
jgi:hypothetical protein